MEASEKSAIALLKAEQKAKRAMTRANNLREQQKLERELIEATEGITRKSKEGAQQIWRDATGTSGSAPRKKRPVSQGLESEENPSKVQKTSIKLSSSGKPVKPVQSTAGGVKKEKQARQTASIPPAADLDSTASEDSDSFNVAPKKPLGRSTKKRTASDLAGGARKDSVSSGSSEDSESDSDASQVSPDEDDALAAGRLDSNQSTEQFAAEAVTFVGRNKDVQSLFDDDEDVVMARPRMRASSTSSGGRTVPASSETDGLGYGAASEKMDQDEDESDIPGPCISLKAKGKIKATKTQTSNESSHVTGSGDSDNVAVPALYKKSKSKKPRKAGVKRTAAFKNEQPTVAEQASNGRDVKSRPTDITNPSSWPAHARIIPNPSGNGEMRLQQQDPLICRLIRDGMEVVAKHALVTHAWPDIDSGTAFRSDILQQVTKSHRASDPRVDDIIERVKVDADFAKQLGAAMVSRLPTLRSPVKMSASTEIAGFMLGKGSRCIERVKALREKDLYIFPGDWTPDNLWKPERDRPFLNEALIDILKTSFFATSAAVGYKFQDTYVSTVDGRTERELPISMIALAATGMYAALSDWSGGKQVTSINGRVGAKFEGNLFIGTYRRLVGVLEALRKQSPIGFHSILAEMYTKVLGDTVAEANQPSGALDVMDVSRYE